MDLKKTALIALFSIAAFTATAQQTPQQPPASEKDNNPCFLQKLTDKTFVVVTKTMRLVGNFFVRKDCDKGERAAVLSLSNMAAGRFEIKPGPGEDPLFIGPASDEVLKTFSLNKRQTINGARPTVARLQRDAQITHLTGCWQPEEQQKPTYSGLLEQKP
jgi:hypothetical protein